MVWSEGNMSLKNPVTTPGIDGGTVRLVAQRFNHYATPGQQHLNFHKIRGISWLMEEISAPKKGPYSVVRSQATPSLTIMTRTVLKD